MANEGCEYTLTEDDVTGPVCVISSRATLLSQHPMNLVEDHIRAWSFISSSVAGSDVQERLMSCDTTVAEAWTTLKAWVLPSTRAELSLLEADLHNVECNQTEPPKKIFAKIDTAVKCWGWLTLRRRYRSSTLCSIDFPIRYSVLRRPYSAVIKT